MEQFCRPRAMLRKDLATIKIPPEKQPLVVEEWLNQRLEFKLIENTPKPSF